MVTQEDLMPESIIMRWFSFEKKPSFLEESYGTVILRLGLLLFAALLFRMVLVQGELNAIWALIALGFSLLVSMVLMIVLDYLTTVQSAKRFMVFGIGMLALMVLIMFLPVF